MGVGEKKEGERDMECRTEDMNFTDGESNEGEGLGKKKRKRTSTKRDREVSYRETGSKEGRRNYKLEKEGGEREKN